MKAVTESAEGAEDSSAAGAEAATEVTGADLAIGIAASGTTPFVHGFIEAGREGAAFTWLDRLQRCPETSLYRRHHHSPHRAEIVAGSTRLKAGTATKMLLNMISTATMIALGGTHDGLMIDVVPSNAKLVRRASAIVAEVSGRPIEEARDCLSGRG